MLNCEDRLTLYADAWTICTLYILFLYTKAIQLSTIQSTNTWHSSLSKLFGSAVSSFSFQKDTTVGLKLQHTDPSNPLPWPTRLNFHKNPPSSNSSIQTDEQWQPPHSVLLWRWNMISLYKVLDDFWELKFRRQLVQETGNNKTYFPYLTV